MFLIKQYTDKYLFNPWEAPKEVLESAGVVSKNYPEPIVDLKISRDIALEPLLQQRKIIMNDSQIKDSKDESISWTCRHTWALFNQYPLVLAWMFDRRLWDHFILSNK